MTQQSVWVFPHRDALPNAPLPFSRAPSLHPSSSSSPTIIRHHLINLSQGSSPAILAPAAYGYGRQHTQTTREPPQTPQQQHQHTQTTREPPQTPQTGPPVQRVRVSFVCVGAVVVVVAARIDAQPARRSTAAVTETTRSIACAQHTPQQLSTQHTHLHAPAAPPS